MLASRSRLPTLTAIIRMIWNTAPMKDRLANYAEHKAWTGNLLDP